MRALLAVLMCVCLAAPLRAQQEPSAAARDAIEQAIRSQITAFQHDDAAAAFAFAAPGTQQRFGDADRFLEIVRRGYPPVYRPRSVDFTTLSLQDGAMVQAVELVGPDGAAYTALYTMEQQADGTWRIVACELLASQRLGA